MTATEAGKTEGPSADDYALVAKAAAEVEAPDLALSSADAARS